MKVKFGILGCMALVISGPMADGMASAKPSKAKTVSREPDDWEYVSGRWLVTNIFGESCTLASLFNGYDKFAIMTERGNHALDLDYENWGYDSEPEVSYTLTIDGKSHDITTAKSGKGWGVSMAGAVDDDLLNRIAAGRSGMISSKGKRNITLDMRGSGKAVAAFRQCVGKGTLPPNAKGARVPQPEKMVMINEKTSHPLQPVTTSLPRKARLEGTANMENYRPNLAGFADEYGQPMVQIVVGTDGKPHDCKVVKLSGSFAIDAGVCTMVKEHYRYNPARDAAGTKIESEVTETIDWSQ